MTPRQLFLTKGVGKHKEKLVSFELALRNAGIAQYNLVKVTSIIPPGCTIISKETGLKHLSPGEIVFCVMSENSTNEKHRLIGASVGIAVPKGKDKYGYLLEYQSFDQQEKDTGSYAESLASEMLVTTLVEEFNGNTNLDEKCDDPGDIAKITNITQTATSEGNGLWTTVVAVVVFVP